MSFKKSGRDSYSECNICGWSSKKPLPEAHMLDFYWSSRTYTRSLATDIWSYFFEITMLMQILDNVHNYFTHFLHSNEIILFEHQLTCQMKKRKRRNIYVYCIIIAYKLVNRQQAVEMIAIIFKILWVDQYLGHMSWPMIFSMIFLKKIIGNHL